MPHIADPALPGEVIYTPEGRPGIGALREMVSELWDSRELTWRLFLRDYSVRYRQTFLGYVWAVLPVVLTVGTFTWLNRMRVLPVAETELPYPVFVLLGTTVWQLFAGGLTAATQSLVGAGSLISKVKFPREVLVVSAFGQSLVDFAVRAVLVAAFFAAFGIAPAWTILAVPLALLPLCGLCLGISFFTALANGLVRDVGQMVPVVLTFWMFLTPVVYPLPSSGPAAMLRFVNPVAPFVVAARDLSTRGYLSEPVSYAAACGIGMVVFLLGWWGFHTVEPRLAERI